MLTRHDSETLELLVPEYKHDPVRVELGIELPVRRWERWRELKRGLYAWANRWQLKTDARNSGGLSYDSLLVAVAKSLAAHFEAQQLEVECFSVGPVGGGHPPAGTRITWRPGA